MIVSTPQDIALIDARRGANMFRQVDVPVSVLALRDSLLDGHTFIKILEVYFELNRSKYVRCVNSFIFQNLVWDTILEMGSHS